MLPFMQVQPSSSSAPQQQGNNNNNNNNMMLPNLQSQMAIGGYINQQQQQSQQRPNFNPMHASSSILGTVPPQNINNFGQFGNMGQHGNMANPPGFGFGGQLGWQQQQQQLGNMNMNMNMPMFNPSQVVALAQLMVAQGMNMNMGMNPNPQNGAFVGNMPQLGFNGMGMGMGMAQQASFGQQQQQMLPLAPQQRQNVSLAQSSLASLYGQHSQSPGFQGNPGKAHPSSDQQQSKNFRKNFQKDSSNRRFQKPQDRQMHDSKRKHKFSEDNGGEGIRSPGSVNCGNESKDGKQRSLSAPYTDKEIQQWREERKKNYPSHTNVEKKLADADAANEEAKIRRKQQLKDVLAKQVELGFEVPEIPSHYLSDTEDRQQGRDRRNGKPLSNGRYEKRFDKKGRYDRNNRFDRKRGRDGNTSFNKNEGFNKRHRTKGDDSVKIPSQEREPTLLQKLLSKDMKRDRSRLLQAVRFMVVNSFFKDWPEKPLNFPKVIVKDTEGESEVIEEFFSSKGEPADCTIGVVDPVDSDGQNEVCQEEGEITD